MTRKDFVALAEILSQDVAPYLIRAQYEDVVEEFIVFCRRSNSNFDASRFRSACGLED